jgi:hypothetical protein
LDEFPAQIVFFPWMSRLDELPADEPDEEEAPEDEENRDEDDDSTWSGKNPWDFGEEEDDVQLGVSTKSGRALPKNGRALPAKQCGVYPHCLYSMVVTWP